MARHSQKGRSFVCLLVCFFRPLFLAFIPSLRPPLCQPTLFSFHFFSRPRPTDRLPRPERRPNSHRIDPNEHVFRRRRGALLHAREHNEPTPNLAAERRRWNDRIPLAGRSTATGRRRRRSASCEIVSGPTPLPRFVTRRPVTKSRPTSR